MINLMYSDLDLHLKFGITESEIMVYISHDIEVAMQK